MSEVDALAPDAPVYISPTACRLLGGAGDIPPDVTLHDRYDPCGHADSETAVPTFAGFVEDAAAGLTIDVDVGVCAWCGDALEDPPPPPVVDVDDQDDDPAWTPASTFTDTDGVGETRTCQHCGSEVSKRYVDVFEPEGVDQPRCCPNCEGIIREHDGTIREARSTGGQPRD